LIKYIYTPYLRTLTEAFLFTFIYHYICYHFFKVFFSLLLQAIMTIWIHLCQYIWQFKMQFLRLANFYILYCKFSSTINSNDWLKWYLIKIMIIFNFILNSLISLSFCADLRYLADSWSTKNRRNSSRSYLPTIRD